MTLRGKRLPLSGASPTLTDLYSILPSGLKPADVTVTYDGEKLTDADKPLSELGVEDGGLVNVKVKKSAKAKPEPMKKPKEAIPNSMPKPGAGFGLDALMAQAPDDLKEILSELPANGMPTDPRESLKLMKKLMASPSVTSFLDSPAQLEMARKALSENAMVKTMLESSMPGISSILADSVTFGLAIRQARDMLLNLGEAEMENMIKMMEAQGGVPGMGGGMGGMGGMGAPKELDELDEDDD